VKTKLALSSLALALASPPGAAQCELGELRAADGGVDDRLGSPVCLRAGVLLTGASGADGAQPLSGAAYVFERGPEGWLQTAKLAGSDGRPETCLGVSVALLDGTALVGDQCQGDATVIPHQGSVYVFERSGTDWVEAGQLFASDPGRDDWFGGALAASGTRALIGALGNDVRGAESGSAYVFERGATAWSQTQQLIGSSTGAGDRFGTSVAIDADVAVVGADGDDDGGLGAGAVYVFEHVGASWAETRKLVAADAGAGQRFGSAVSLQGERMLVGAPLGQGGTTSSGAAYVFERVAGIWLETAKLAADDGADLDAFGVGVALEGERAAIGAFQAGGAGAVYLFELDGATWRQLAKLTAADAEAGDAFGLAVDLGGATLAVGAPGDGAPPGSGSLRLFAVPRLGDGYCYGSGCPCGNDSASGGCASSTGAGARMRGCGSASVTADDLVLRIDGLPARQLGLFFMGAARIRVPFGDGQRCVGAGGAGIQRFLAAQSSGPEGVLILGPGIARRSLAFPVPGRIDPGETWSFQGWYRDAAGPCGSGFNLSNAVAVTFAP